MVMRAILSSSALKLLIVDQKFKHASTDRHVQTALLCGRVCKKCLMRVSTMLHFRGLVWLVVMQQLAHYVVLYMLTSLLHLHSHMCSIT
jgi:hypothetical protein